MKYVYYYQTKDNENRTGEIKARDRAEAYTLLRKGGIRPYRVVGDDPFNWRPYAIAFAFVLLVAATAVSVGFALDAKSSPEPPARHQIEGDAAYVESQMALNWCDVLPTKLDQALALYVQPGCDVFHPDLTEEEIAALVRDLDTTLSIGEKDRSEVRQLKEMILIMRGEIRSLLAQGGTLQDYLQMLAERQDQEISLRAKAFESFERTPRDLRRRAFAALNMRLKDARLAPLPDSLLESAR